MDHANILEKPARYFPFATQHYSTAPGLHRLGTDFGNGLADNRLFQLDNQWQTYRHNKDTCRKENPDKYYCRQHERSESRSRACQLIVSQLLQNYPAFFTQEQNGKTHEFRNRLSRETILFDQMDNLLAPDHYTDLLDALTFQVQEDLAIWQAEGEKDWMSTIHLSAPNHWVPSDKVGRPFSLVHRPVADMEQMRKRYQPMLKSLLRGGSFVRFAWGLSTDTRLNHHPVPPIGVEPRAWEGRSFDPDNPNLYIRTERQTLTGFAEEEAVLFIIRTYFENVNSLSVTQKFQLRQALKSMSQDTLEYKGLAHCYDQLLRFLQ